MAEWRYLTRWSEHELAQRLEKLPSLRLNFDPEAEMSPRLGWNLTCSHAVIAQEEEGPPRAEGAFHRLWDGIAVFHHSDPRIVVAHFRHGAPLTGRRILLELRAIGLGYLCPTAIGPIREESNGRSTLRGFALDTLEGHIERGREWFLLEKDHESGAIRFRIEATWRSGDFPNRWSRLGFELVGRRYQRAWHRLAHLRLRQIAAGIDPADVVGTDGVEHAGTLIVTGPVQFYAQRGIGRAGVDVELEKEDMRKDRLWRALGLGALSGVRSMGPPALVVSRLERRGRGILSGRRSGLPLGRSLAVLSKAEIVADKLPFTPSRTKVPSLVARGLSGALVGAATARRQESMLAPALLGAGAALAATWGSFQLRRAALARSRWLGYAVAVAEDGLVLWAGGKLADATAGATRSLRDPLPRRRH